MKTILVVRKYDNFSRILAANSFDVINFPLIETKAADDLSEFDAKLDAIKNYDGVFLTSRTAAEIFRAKLVEKKLNYCGRVYILGRRSYKILKAENLNLFFDETANTAREMLEKIALEDLTDKNFLFVRGEKSLRVIPDFLSKKSSVDEAIVYRTENLTVEKNEVEIIGAKIKRNEVFGACFFSPSAAESFTKLFGVDILHQTIIAAIGRSTAEFFRKQKLKVGFVSSKAAAEDFAVQLIEDFKGRLSANKHG